MVANNANVMIVVASTQVPPSIDSHFTLPLMQCSFPAKLNPDYERVREKCEPWILNLVQPKSRKFLSDCLLPRYVCRLFPETADLPRLMTVTKFIAWLTLADDVVDTAVPCAELVEHMVSHDGGPRSAVATWAHSVLFELHEPRDREALCAEAAPIGLDSRRLALLDALRELWKEMSGQLTPQARIRFISVMKDHLEAVCLHPTNNPTFVDHDRAIMSRSVKRYMGIRRVSSGFVLGFELLLYVLGLDDDPIHLHTLVHELRNLVIDYMCMCNDMVSFRMETSAGDYFNLPCIVYNSGAADTFQEALDIVAEMMEQADARCVQVVDAIRRNEELVAMEPKLEMYLVTMMSCMSGTLRWSFETTRYGLKHQDGTPSG